MKSTKIEFAVAGAMGLALVGVTGEASAAGFMLREQSSEYLGNSFAGSAARADSPATIWYNPAGMTMLHGHQIAGSLTWIAPQARFSGSSLVGGGPGGDAIDDAAVGSTFAMFDYSKDLKFGIAVVSPFGLRTSYPANWAGRFQGVASAITNIQVNPNVAYRVNQNLSIGAGITGSWVEADLSQATMTPFGLTRLKGDAYGFGWNVGALWEFSPDTRVGIAYRSNIRNGLDGEMTSLSLGGFKLADINADLTLPGTATFSFFHRIDDKWSVMADAQWTQWSVLKSLDVYTSAGAPVARQDFSWRDTWFFSLGADYVWSKGHTLHFGAAYDMGAIKDAQHRGVRVPDADRYWLSTGYTWDVNENVRWNLAYAHLFAPTSDAVSTLGDGLVGNYKASVDIVSTSFVYKF
jgi:long-chain fatty acid transport protein